MSENGADKVSVFDNREQKVQRFGSKGDKPEQMNHPVSIAIDGMDNIYVANFYKLQKFTSHGELIN